MWSEQLKWKKIILFKEDSVLNKKDSVILAEAYFMNFNVPYVLKFIS